MNFVHGALTIPPTIEAAATRSQQCRDFPSRNSWRRKFRPFVARRRASIQHFASTLLQARFSQNFCRLAHRTFSNVSFSFTAEWELLKADFCKIVERSCVFCHAALCQWKLCDRVVAWIIPNHRFWLTCAGLRCRHAIIYRVTNSKIGYN